MVAVAIRSFRGRYRPLSNFSQRRRGVEHVFQAAKVTDPKARSLILNASSPQEAKWLGSRTGMVELSGTLGRPIVLRADWEEIKNEVMAWALRRKFADPILATLLLSTGDAELVEGNTWHDTEWGVCTCPRHRGQGANKLGHALMLLREELRAALPA